MRQPQQDKSFEINKHIVLKAFEQTKAHQGASGIDGVSISNFEENLKDNLYKIWNRMSSGSYFPSPTLEVEIPKPTGGTRTLGIPTVEDRIAQGVVKAYIEPRLEEIFHDDSFGYRPKRSCHRAIETTRKRCWSHDWVIDLDIKAFFDSIDHDLLEKAVRHHISEPWIILYIKRWIKAPTKKKDGSQQPRHR